MLQTLYSETQQSRINHTSSDVAPVIEKHTITRDELRRQMYERIAAGNALNESEASAKREWQHRST